MADTPVIAFGSRVSLRYRLTLADGTVAESNFEHGEPLLLTVGDGTLPTGLELVLLGKRPGDSLHSELPAAQAWGAPNPEFRYRLSRGDFPADIQPQGGQIIEFTTPSGEVAIGTVLGVEGDEVEVDFNHPLAGKAISFEAQVLSAEPPRP